MIARAKRFGMPIPDFTKKKNDNNKKKRKRNKKKNKNEDQRSDRNASSRRRRSNVQRVSKPRYLQRSRRNVGSVRSDLEFLFEVLRAKV